MWPPKSTPYLTNSLATVVSYHVIFRLLTFQVPYLKSFLHLLCFSKGSIQVKCFVSIHGEQFFGPQPKIWRSTAFPLSSTSYSIYTQLPSTSTEHSFTHFHTSWGRDKLCWRKPLVTYDLKLSLKSWYYEGKWIRLWSSEHSGHTNNISGIFGWNNGWLLTITEQLEKNRINNCCILWFCTTIEQLSSATVALVRREKTGFVRS